MANTYTLINSTSLSTTAASVTFSSIPATYDDLVLRFSVRGSIAGTSNAPVLCRPNSVSATEYSWTHLYGNGSAALSTRQSTISYLEIDAGAPSAGDTSNTFGNSELYIPGYRSATNKPMSTCETSENNATLALRSAKALLWRNTAVISSLFIYNAAGNFVSGSTFWLYGIKNS